MVVDNKGYKFILQTVIHCCYHMELNFKYNSCFEIINLNLNFVIIIIVIILGIIINFKEGPIV